MPQADARYDAIPMPSQGVAASQAIGMILAHVIVNAAHSMPTLR
jgi:hypothetical protein